MMRFIHVGFSRLTIPRREIERVFDRHAEDWLRYAPNCWILWTDRPVETLLRAVRRVIDADEEVLFAAISTQDLQGYMDKSVWDWFNKPRH